MTVPAQHPGHRHRLPYTPGGRRERAVGRGLDFTRTVLAEHQPDADPAAIGDVLLVVAELLANAAEHAGGPTALELRLGSAGGRKPASVRIEVTDTSATLPHSRNPGLGEPHGRGLRIIERTASDWGAAPVPGGKTVWAELPLPVPAGVDRGTGAERS